MLFATTLYTSLVQTEDLNCLYHKDYAAFFERWEVQARLAATCTHPDSTIRIDRHNEWIVNSQYE